MANCEPIFSTKSLTVGASIATGIPTRSRFINPNPDPSVWGDAPLPGTTREDYNWYKSCLVTEIEGFPTPQYWWRANHYSGPTYDGTQRPLPGISFYYSFYNSANYPEQITDGCSTIAQSSSGPITGVRVVQQGARLGTANPAFVVSGGGSGTNATFNISVSGGTLNGVSVQNGGQDYKVGDTFEVTSTGNFSSPENGSFEVTSIATNANPKPLEKINWWVQISYDGNQDTNPDADRYHGLTYEAQATGYAVGDIIEILVSKENNSGPTEYQDVTAKFEVTDIDVKGSLDSSATLNYLVEEGVGLVYTRPDLDRVINMVDSYDNTSDPVLQQSADAVFDEWLSFLGRKPSDLEFEYAVKQVYKAGGTFSTELFFDLIGEPFSEELETPVAVVQSYCDRLAEEEYEENLPPEPADCVWDKRDFYQGSQSAATNIELEALYNFLGQPNGPSGPGGGADAPGDIICPKPDNDGGIDDQEPDMSDFAGMRLWRWIPCEVGTGPAGPNENIDPNLGQYQEIIVPCPGDGEGCVAPETEDSLAIYHNQATVYFNNNTDKIGNFVKSTKDETARIINDQFVDLLDRPAEQDGLNYWYEASIRTISDQYADYWYDGYLKYNDGSEFNVPLVKQAFTSNGQAIYFKYFEELGRPPEQAGFAYWAAQADRDGLDGVLRDIEIGAQTELERGGINFYEFGLDRVLRHIAWQAQTEIDEKRGVKQFRLYCENYVPQQMDLSYFKYTRIPPTYGTISIGPPKITPTELADTRTFKYKPSSQTERVASFQNDSVSPFMSQFFDFSWPVIEGDLFGENPPIYIKYAEIELFQSYNGADYPTGIKLLDYDNDLLREAGVVGSPVLSMTEGGYSASMSFQTPGQGFGSESFILADFAISDLMAGGPGYISVDKSNEYAFNAGPKAGSKYYFKVTLKAYLFDPDTERPIPGLVRSTSYLNRGDTKTMRYISALNNDGCQEYQECADGSTRCVTEECPDNNGCSGLSILCGGNNTLQVETNDPTTIRFNYKVSGANSCDTKGSATVSIRKYWPCPVFGPPSGRENQWATKNNVPVTKVRVNIVNGEATFDLPVNTSKDDYLATSGQTGSAEDPGNCHWVYEAYWEIEGMNGTSIQCKPNLWENPGCDNGTVFNDLPEVLCVQKQACSGATNCSGECPVCDQTIKVVIGDTTQCGAVNFPVMIEQGGPGLNNGAFSLGSTLISVPGTPVTIDRTAAGVFTRQVDNKKVVPVTLENWVTVQPARTGSQTTLGKDNAVDFSGEDNQALFEECCPNNTTTFECQDFIGRGNCFDNGETQTQEVDCNAQMRVVAQWYYKVKYKDSPETGLIPLAFYSNYDTPNEQEVFNIDQSYYPVSAGNNTNGSYIAYNQEINFGSFYTGITDSYLPADDSVESIRLYLQIKSSNDQWGDDKFNPPPAGFNERDFGTDITITSPRPPHNIGSSPGPKPTIFEVGSFRLGNTANLPSADWTMGISGCADAQVYDTKPSSNPGSFTCGDINGDNWYKGSVRSWFTEEEGKANGQDFFRDIYISGSACAGSVPNFNPVDGTGFNQKPAFCPTTYLPSFTNCYNQSDVRLKATGIGSVDYGDYNPGGCETGVKLLWYVDGVVRSKGYSRQGLGSNDSKYTFNLASCQELWEDLGQWMTDSTRTYTVSLYAVVNNISNVAKKPVNRDWTTQNGDPYNFSGGDIRIWGLQRGDRAYPIEIVNAGGVAGEPIVIPRNAAWNQGDVFQVILSTATCTVRGGGTSGDKELNDLLQPEFTLSATEAQPNTISIPGIGVTIDCTPECCNGGSGGDCGKGIAEICGDKLCAGGINGSGALTATIQNLPQAWPTIPGTQNKVTGDVQYKWEKKNNNSSSYQTIPNATGDTIGYIADGGLYRCTVTYDLTGKVPNGYTANPSVTTRSKIYSSSNIDYETCEDGEVRPIGTCPDVGTPCDSPTLGSALPVARSINLLKASTTSPFYQNLTLNNNENVNVVLSPIIIGFDKVDFIDCRFRLLVNGVQTGLFNMQVATATATTRVMNATAVRSGSNRTNTFGALYVVRYRCSDGQERSIQFTDPSTVTATWQGEDNGGYPKLVTNPQCYNTAGYTNQSKCGSYLGEWKNSASAAPQLYYQTQKTTKLSDRGVPYSAGVANQNANCAFCPPADCPALNIARVNVSPSSPKVGEKVTLQVIFNSDYSGFTPTNNVVGNQTAHFWQGPGVPALNPVTFTHPAQIQVGPFNSKGQRSYSVDVSQFFKDPNDQCPTASSPLGFSTMTDSYSFNIQVGDDDQPPPPPSEEPEFYNVSISGPSSLEMDDNGKAFGTYTVTYQLTDGEGYIPNTRAVAAKWDGGDETFSLTYQRTFTQEGQNNVSVQLNKLFCPTEVGADRCIKENILGGNPPLSSAEADWIRSATVQKNVTVTKKPVVGNNPPVLNVSVSANKTTATLNASGQAVINFTATVTENDGDWGRTQEPAAMRYNKIDNTNSGSILNTNAGLSQTWSRTFTTPGTYFISARYRRNYCPPGTGNNTATCVEQGFVDEGGVTVTIKSSAPVGTPPTASMAAPGYSFDGVAGNPVINNGCAQGLNPGLPVTVTYTINVAGGTGSFVWNNVSAPGYTNVGGGRLQKAVTYRTKGQRSANESAQVQFFQGSTLVHTTTTNAVAWCVDISTLNVNI